MASTKFSTGWRNGVWYEASLTHDEIESICTSATPVAALLGLIPQMGHVIAVAITLSSFWLRRVDKKSGGRGARIMFRVVGGLKPTLALLPFKILPPSDAVVATEHSN
jgi:hypothetical protein